MEFCDLQEILPVFHLSPRTLQELAATQCALDCWHNVIIMRNFDSDGIWSAEWLKEQLSSFSYPDIASFPVGVISLIDRKKKLIGKEITDWCGDHPSLKLSPAVMVNCVVLNSGGDICYKRTAKNLLTANPAFSLKEQFEIACKYCFEEDVERLWVSLGNDHYYHSLSFHISSDYAGPKDYWCSKMRGELQEFYKKANEEEERSPEWFVLSNRRRTNITNWAQVEYFWHKLNREEQSSIVRDIMLDQRFTKHLILKSDDMMLRNLPRSYLKWVIEILARDELSHEHALQIWSYVNVKNIIIENADSFYKILVSLSEMAFRSPRFYGFHISRLLKEMWLSASVDFKNLVLCNPNHLEALFERSLVRISIRSFSCDVGFFIELLNGASFETRQHIWQRWWRKFFLLARVSDVLELIKECFNNADDIVQFKKNFMLDYDELRGIITEFIEGGFHDELTEYLKFCCSDDVDEKFVSETRRELALRNFYRINRCDSELFFVKFLRFFYDSVSSADLAYFCTWGFQDKEANLLSMCVSFDKGGLRIFTKALRYFEFSDQRVMELKQFFYERCQYVLMSGDFYSFFVQDWEEFLIWCSPSAENVNRLRGSIAIDDLFENFLINMHKTFCIDCGNTSVVKYGYYRKHVFNSIDCLLRWYFKDHEDEVATARQFKYGKMIGYESSETVNMVLNMENDEILRDVLLWFFDYERYEQLKKFLVLWGHENFSWKGHQNVVRILEKIRCE